MGGRRNKRKKSRMLTLSWEEELKEKQYQMKDPLLRPHEVEYMKGILAHKEKDFQRANDELRAYMNQKKGGTSHA